MQASACGIRLPSLSFARGSPVRYARARCSPLKPTCAGPFKSSLPPHRSNTRKLGCSTVSCPWHTALNRRPLEPCTERFAVHLNGAEDFSARRADGKEDDDAENGGLLSRIKWRLTELSSDPGVLLWLQLGQITASLLFVVLYVWSTYSAPAHSSWRYKLDLSLCVLFAVEYAFRVLGSENRVKAFLSFWNLLDLFAVFPPLLEWVLLCLHYSTFSALLARFDFRWFKILRAMRVMRVSLLAGEIRSVKLSSGALLSGAASIRLYQLVASVLSLLFTTSSIVVLVERIPFHDALYFVTTTLTTVGFGDVVAISAIGKFAVLAMILVGVVLIPVQTSQLYAQLTARRVTLGSLPDGKVPTVLVSTQLSDVRGFADFFTEFFQAQKKSSFPLATRMVTLCNRPNYEFRAFQEMNEPRLTLMEGSVLSDRDLVRSRAEAAQACLLLADRFSSSARQEDISIQFQVWALKAYTKRVPLYVQVLLTSSQAMIQPFLDPDQDVVVSVEQTRHRLLALSCLCPGASTLIANLLRRSAVSAARTHKRTLAGRRWMRAYVNGCAHKVFSATINSSLAGVPFVEAAEWMHRSSGCVLIGALRDGRVVLNPGRRLLRGTETVVVVGPSQKEVSAAAAAQFQAARPRQLQLCLPDCLPPDSAASCSSLALGLMKEVNGELQCAPMENGVTCYVPESESLDVDHSHSLDSDDLYCILPDGAVTGLDRPATLPLHAQEASAEAGTSGRAVALRGRTSFVRRRVSSNGNAASMGAFLEGFREPLQQDPEVLTSLSYDSEDEEGGDDEVIEALSYAGVAHRDWYGRRNGSTTASGEEPGNGGSRGRAAAVNLGWSLSGRQPNTEQGSSAVQAVPQAALHSPGGNGAGRNGAGSNGFTSPAVVKEPTVLYVDDEKYFERETVKSQSPTAVADEGEARRSLPDEESTDEMDGLTDHVILCGAEESFLPFLQELRRCDPFPTPVVILHPRRPTNSWIALHANGPIHFVKGEPWNGDNLRAARSQHARALVYLTGNQRPQQGGQEEGSRGGNAPEQSRVAVLADAQALLTCYGVGEHGGAVLPHAVVELCYTSSVRFLQPGLLLMGVGMGEDPSDGGAVLGPRKSWLMRKRQEMAAVREGLSEWQANSYYCAGRVTVPALMDTFACHCFFNKGMMVELLEELAGDDNMPGGALLQQINVPSHLIGRPYGELVMLLTLTQHLIPLGLYRRKSENKASRLFYVMTNPRADELLEPGDRVFVVRERGVAALPLKHRPCSSPW